MSALSDELKDYINDRDKSVEQRVKFWVVGAALTNVLALLPVIFFLGGIYQNANASLDLLKEQQKELAQRGLWMQDRERFELAVELWAEPKGFKAPKYIRRGGESK